MGERDDSRMYEAGGIRVPPAIFDLKGSKTLGRSGDPIDFGRRIQFEHETLFLRVEQIMARRDGSQTVDVVSGGVEIVIGGNPEKAAILEAFEDVE
jgi:hypothetical protein